MIGAIAFGHCPTCKGPNFVPTFSTSPVTPFCPHCDALREEPTSAMSEADRREYAVRLSANVGNYQTALLDGDAKAAEAFLANVAEICATLRR